MEGPEILVPAMIVQPLALVVHELLINAAVHGSLSAPSGRLNIHWQEVLGQGGFKLRWEETGAYPIVRSSARFWYGNGRCDDRKAASWQG